MPRVLAAAQIVPRPGDVAANVEEHLRLVRAAAKERAHVLVFPELSLTGYELDRAEELAFSEDDARLGPLVAAASSSGMTLVAGAPVRIGPALCIGAFIVVPGGTLALYTKRHLGAFQPDVNPAGVVPPAEDTVFRPGERDPLVPFGEHTAALAVCSDTGRPEHSDAAARRGATTYLASMFVIPADYEGEAARLESTAGRHSMAVVMANFGGPSGGLASGGGSAIWSDRGELLVRLDAAGSGVAVAREDEAGWSARAVML